MDELMMNIREAISGVEEVRSDRVRELEFGSEQAPPPICYARSEVKLPRGEQAIVDIAKLRDYCLNASHPRGRYKARVFAAALGITADDAAFLQQELLRAAREEEAIEGDADEYGRRYEMVFTLTRGGRTAKIHSGWIVRRSDELPRLTTCYVE